MPNGVRRLNRRRYRESVAALKEIIGDQKTPALRKLRAIDVLLGIYDRHDRSEAAKEARKRAVDAQEMPGQPGTSPESSERVQETAEDVDTFLARIRGMKQQETEIDDEQD